MFKKQSDSLPVMLFKTGDIVHESRIYRCSGCHTIKAFLQDETFRPCDICSEKNRKQTWITTRKEILVRTKNIAKEFERKKTIIDKLAEKITCFFGSMKFVLLHVIWFGSWIVYNVFSPTPFDHFPFGFLTLTVSLEAIVLSTFILITQNRQSEINDLRGDLDYNVDVQSEKHINEIVTTLREIHRHFLPAKKQ